MGVLYVEDLWEVGLVCWLVIGVVWVSGAVLGWLARKKCGWLGKESELSPTTETHGRRLVSDSSHDSLKTRKMVLLT